MKTLHTAYRVSDLVRSVDFYQKVGYREIGRVTFEGGSVLVMLNLPGDGDEVTLELAYDPNIAAVDIGTGFSHIVVQVDTLDATLADLAAKSVGFDEPQRPAGEHGPKTCFLRDPDGYRIELVEWPPGHPDGLTRADFP
jgi:lactoylglutathione lyase